MHRFYVQPGDIIGNRVCFPAREWHHLKQVLRLSPGEMVTVFDGEGNQYLVEVGEETGTIVGPAPQQVEPELRVTLAQGIAKGDKMDFIIQKAVELGIYRLVPLVTEHTVVRLQDKERRRIERWQRISEEACKQCGRSFIPRVAELHDLERLTREYEGQPAIFCYEAIRGQGYGLKTALKQLRERTAGEVLLVVGPEGGFSPREAGLAREAGWHICGLGPRVLRTETASLAALSMLMYDLADLGQ